MTTDRSNERGGFAAAVNRPWAIQPEMLQQVRAAAEAYLKGERERPTAAELIGQAKSGPRLQIGKGVAVIALHGLLVKQPSVLGWFFQETATQEVAFDVRTAAADPNIHSIVLHVDSPGGHVDGTETLARLIYSVRGVKPVVAVIDGLGASAAYFIASAADVVVVTEETTVVGSIGVAINHLDSSKREEQFGLKITEVTAGKHKRSTSQHQPLSDEGRADLQARVDHIYGVFVRAVARHRGVSEDFVLNEMADGRVFMGDEAVERRLVDGIAYSLPEVIAELRRGDTTSAFAVRSERAARFKRAFPDAAEAIRAARTLDERREALDRYEAEYHSVCAAVRAEFEARRKALPLSAPTKPPLTLKQEGLITRWERIRKEAGEVQA